MVHLYQDWSLLTFPRIPHAKINKSKILHKYQIITIKEPLYLHPKPPYRFAETKSEQKDAESPTLEKDCPSFIRLLTIIMEAMMRSFCLKLFSFMASPSWLFRKGYRFFSFSGSAIRAPAATAG